jgi:hypothetical protein
MTCEAFEKGKCKLHHNTPCPVIPVYRDMVPMKACAVVAKGLGMDQYTGENIQ